MLLQWDMPQLTIAAPLESRFCRLVFSPIMRTSSSNDSSGSSSVDESRRSHLEWLSEQRREYSGRLSQASSMREEDDDEFAMGSSDLPAFLRHGSEEDAQPSGADDTDRPTYRSLFDTMSLAANSSQPASPSGRLDSDWFHSADQEIDFSDEVVYRSLPAMPIRDEGDLAAHEAESEVQQQWLAEARPPLVRRQRGFGS